MVNADEEVARRRKVMAEAAALTNRALDEILEERLARTIKASLEEEAESLSVEDALRKIAAF